MSSRWVLAGTSLAIAASAVLAWFFHLIGWGERLRTSRIHDLRREWLGQGAELLYDEDLVYRELKMFAFVEMFLFIILILAGFLYIWKKGALDWSGADRDDRRSSKSHAA